MEENVSTQVEMSAALGTLATCSSTAYMQLDLEILQFNEINRVTHSVSS